jgi:hypothetical protein
VTVQTKLPVTRRNRICALPWQVVAGVSALTPFLLGCASKTAEVVAAPTPDTVTVIDTVMVDAGGDATAALERRIARLQLQLMERDAQVEEFQRRLGEAIQEVVRSMAKLQTTASRAEAASAMAEAEIALDALRAAGPETAPIQQAEQLLQMSSTEFNRENYGGSLYLASEARSIARAGGGLLAGREGATLRAGEVPFALPLTVQTVRRSNVRDGPGLGFKILYTASSGTPLVGRSHTEEWIRVSDERGREGWIFHSLVRTRSEVP